MAEPWPTTRLCCVGAGKRFKRFRLMPSSVIRSFHYDPAAHTLDVQFVSGRRYAYLDVPEREVEAMRRATSKGGFFNRRIRDRYRFERR